MSNKASWDNCRFIWLNFNTFKWCAVRAIASLVWVCTVITHSYKWINLLQEAQSVLYLFLYLCHCNSHAEQGMLFQSPSSVCKIAMCLSFRREKISRHLAHRSNYQAICPAIPQIQSFMWCLEIKSSNVCFYFMLLSTWPLPRHYMHHPWCCCISSNTSFIKIGGLTRIMEMRRWGEKPLHAHLKHGYIFMEMI